LLLLLLFKVAVEQSNKFYIYFIIRIILKMFTYLNVKA
jgi:hypothetical protein